MLKKGQLKTLKDIILKKCDEYSENTAFLEKDKKTKEFQGITYKKLKEDVISLSTALSIKYNLLGEKIAIIGENSYNWYMSYMAVTTGTGIVVPLDKELPENEIINLINRSDAKCIIYSGKKKNAIDSIRSKLPSYILYISMDKDGKGQDIALPDVLEEGKKLVSEGEEWYYNQEISPDDFRILIFTSGTTSTSKGVMLCHRNVISNLDGATEILKVDVKDRFFSVLPMHHIYEMIVTCMYAIANGSSVAICEGLKYISKDIKNTSPTVLVCVPLLVEHICKRINKTIEEQKKEKTVKRLINITNKMGKIGYALKRTIFSQIHNSLGGRLKYILVSAAPVEKELINQVEGLGYVVFQGYGLTETASIVAGTREETRRAGTVGTACNCEIKIDAPKGKDGEILVKGNNVMLGYYNDENATKEAIENNWFHTGDIGHFDDKNNLVITGRCKNVIVTNNGKKIFPEELENEINKIDMVKESMVYGDGEGTNMSVCAIVTLDEEEIKAFYGDDMPDKKTIKTKIWEGIKAINDKMVSYKAVKNLKVRDKDFEKTTTMKIKRFLKSNKEEN